MNNKNLEVINEINNSIELKQVEFKPMDLGFSIQYNEYSINEHGDVIHLSVLESEETITDLSRLIIQLSSLKQLAISSLDLENSEWLTDLKELQSISFRNVRLKDFSFLLGLPKLTVLGLSFVRFHGSSSCPFDIIGEKVDLEDLLIQNIELESLEFLKPLNKVKRLFLGDNNISDISPISEMSKLSSFCAWDNQIIDISPLSKLPELEELYIQENRVKDIGPLSQLNSLKIIFANGNNISKVPYELIRINNIYVNEFHATSIRTGLYLKNNPLTSPPLSVVKSGFETVKSYFENGVKYGVKPLSEGRIIFVGDGAAGKSSLINRILYKSFNENKAQTNGIAIEPWSLTNGDRSLKFNFWDFGGQEVQHAVHKFFFTSGCLYVLVLDNRKEEEPEYWLQQIETLGGSAPVMVIFNKFDENRTESVDRKFLKEKYNNIVGFYDVSCKTAYGLEAFIEKLKQHASQLISINDEFPGNWFNIKLDIESRTAKNNYLLYDEYISICKKNGVQDSVTQSLLLRYFSSIGAVTWFGENNAFLSHMHVLNPTWISQGVYKIITGNLTADKKGQISIKDFKTLLKPISSDDHQYNNSHYGYILGLMKRFELCYSEDDINIQIPSRFSKQPKIEYSEFRGSNVRTYILQFKDYVPVSVIHQFIARNIDRAFDKNYWYQGIVIEDADKDSLAMVQLDREAKRLYVRIKSTTPINLWQFIREEFAMICNRYVNLSYSELVTLLPDNNEDNVEYKDLINHLKAGEVSYFHPKLIQRFPVAKLLGMFEPKEKTVEYFKQTHSTQDSEQNQVIVNVQNILSNENKPVNNINIDLSIIQPIVRDTKEDINYLLEEVDSEDLKGKLKVALDFIKLADQASSKEDVQGKGWKRKLKNTIEAIKGGTDIVKNVQDGGEALFKIAQGLSKLADHFELFT